MYSAVLDSDALCALDKDRTMRIDDRGLKVAELVADLKAVVKRTPIQLFSLSAWQSGFICRYEDEAIEHRTVCCPSVWLSISKEGRAKGLRIDDFGQPIFAGLFGAEAVASAYGLPRSFTKELFFEDRATSIVFPRYTAKTCFRIGPDQFLIGLAHAENVYRAIRQLNKRGAHSNVISIQRKVFADQMKRLSDHE